MRKNFPIDANICNISQDQNIPIASDFESNRQLAEQLKETTLILLAEYYRTITFASIQVANTFRSAGYFSPMGSDHIHTAIKKMVADVIRCLDYFDNQLIKILTTKSNGEDKKQTAHEMSGSSAVYVYAAIVAERIRVNEYINDLKFSFTKNHIIELGRTTRKRIGHIVLRYQEDHFINPIN
jgi:hypothetical protein